MSDMLEVMVDALNNFNTDKQYNVDVITRAALVQNLSNSFKRTGWSSKRLAKLLGVDLKIVEDILEHNIQNLSAECLLDVMSYSERLGERV